MKTRIMFNGVYFRIQYKVLGLFWVWYKTRTYESDYSDRVIWETDNYQCCLDTQKQLEFEQLKKTLNQWDEIKP